MLVFCDGELLRAVRRQLVAEKGASQRTNRLTLVLPIVSVSTARSNNELDVADAQLPETIAYYIKDAVEPLDAAEAIKTIRGYAGSEPPAGTLLGVSGVLQLNGDESTSFHGVDSISTYIESGGYRLDAYISVAARDQTKYFTGQVVTIFGICQWVPPYKPGSGSPIAIAIRAAALFSDR